MSAIQELQHGHMRRGIRKVSGHFDCSPGELLLAAKRFGV
jgi:hypothetical protein